MARYKRDYKGERRTATVTAQLTPSEKSELQERAAAMGLTPSEYVRKVVFHGRGPQPAATRFNPVLTEIYRQLAAIGNNLNQIARVANSKGEVEVEDVAAEWHSFNKALTMSLARLEP